MNNDAIPVTVRIMDKEFCVSCPNEERDGLVESARLLDKKMREIRDSRRVIGADRIAVIAALNIAHELIETSSKKEQGGSEFDLRIKSIQEKVETALCKNKQLEL
ncbi:MAG: cell division protein ZapA [Gammaproteobacteria bacterium]|nr:cell division protein ZapA [Gammaproteobacteria bacterium]